MTGWDDAALLRQVDVVVSAQARRRQSLWMLFLAPDGAPLPVVVPVDDVPDRPEQLLIDNLCTILGGVLQMDPEASSVVLVLTRPKVAESDPVGAEWAAAIWAAVRESGVNVRLFCVAAPGRLEVLPALDAAA